MSCVEDRERLSGYADGELDAAERAAVEAHAAACGDCRRAVEDYRRLAGILHGMPRERAPRTLWPAVREQLPGRVVRFSRWLVPSLAAAAALVLGLAVAHFAGVGLRQEMRAPEAEPSAGVARHALARIAEPTAPADEGEDRGALAAREALQEELAVDWPEGVQQVFLLARQRRAGELDQILGDIEAKYAGVALRDSGAPAEARAGRAIQCWSYDATANAANFRLQSAAELPALQEALAREFEVTPVHFSVAESRLGVNLARGGAERSRRAVREGAAAERAGAPAPPAEPQPGAAQAGRPDARAHSHGGDVEGPVEVWVLFEPPAAEQPRDDR